MEALSKLIDFLEKLLPTVIGWLMAKQDSKIEELKEENETLKEYDKIDNSTVSSNDAYNGLFK